MAYWLFKSDPEVFSWEDLLASQDEFEIVTRAGLQDRKP